jgi:hypothetical protein
MASTLPSVNTCCSPCSSTTTVTIATGGTVDGHFVVDDIDALRALTSLATNRLAVVEGGVDEFDGQGGIYTWVAGATNADDGITYIRPNDYTTGGLWRKLI